MNRFFKFVSLQQIQKVEIYFNHFTYDKNCLKSLYQTLKKLDGITLIFKTNNEQVLSFENKLAFLINNYFADELSLTSTEVILKDQFRWENFAIKDLSQAIINPEENFFC